MEVVDIVKVTSTHKMYICAIQSICFPQDIHYHHISHHFHYLHQSSASYSQDGLSEAELKDLEDKGSAGLGDAVGPMVGCLSNEYQQVKVLKYLEKYLEM